MSTIVVTRGFLDKSTENLLRTIPIIENPAVRLSVCSRRLLDFGKSHADKRSPSDNAFEVIVKTGNFTNEALRTITQRKPKIVIISQEAGQPGSLACLASDGLCLIKRSHTPVLLLPTVCSVPRRGKIVVAAIYGGNSSADDGNSVSGLLDLSGAEVVVLVVAPRLRQSLSLVAMGARGRRLKAIQEREHQITSATTQAGLIAARLTQESRSISVGRVGRFADEICHVTQCADTSLVCLLIGRHARKCLSKPVLLELLEKINVPIMLVPSAGE